MNNIPTVPWIDSPTTASMLTTSFCSNSGTTLSSMKTSMFGLFSISFHSTKSSKSSITLYFSTNSMTLPQKNPSDQELAVW